MITQEDFFPGAVEDGAIPIQHRVALRLHNVKLEDLDTSVGHDLDAAQELAGAYFRARDDQHNERGQARG